MNTSWIIYRHVNLINNKSYIGQTCQQPPSSRWGKDGKPYRSETSIFWRAIKKYGWDNFRHEILEKNIKTLEQANEREKYWIKYYDSIKNGYNMTEGGQAFIPANRPVVQIDIKTLEIVGIYDSAIIAERTIKNANVHKVVEGASHSYTAAGYYWCFLDSYNKWEPPIKKTYTVYKIDLSTQRIIAQYESASEVGRELHITPSTVCKYIRKHLILKNYGYALKKEWDVAQYRFIKPYSYRKIYCFETQKEYENRQVAGRELKVHPAAIRDCCIKKVISAKGYHFCYADQRDSFEIRKSNNLVPVQCIETGKKYSSIEEASQDTGHPSLYISRRARGLIKRKKGYHWIRLDKGEHNGEKSS